VKFKKFVLEDLQDKQSRNHFYKVQKWWF